MRCGCSQCGAFMVHAEGAQVACVCPDCGWRCDACLGTNTVVDRDSLKNLARVQWIARDVENERQRLENGRDTEDEV